MRIAAAAGGDPAAVRAAVAGRAGPRVRAARRAAHRARHQRGRDLAHGARHPLRRSTPGWRASSATATAARSSSCRSSRSRQAAANQRAGRCGRVADGVCIRLYDEKDFAERAALHRPRDPALVAGRRDPAHEGAAPGRGGGLSVHRAAAAQGASPTATQLLGRAECGRRRQRADADRPASSSTLPLDPRVGRMILEARDRQALDEVLIIAVGAERAGRARPAARARSRRPTRSTSCSTTRSRSSSATSSCGSGSSRARRARHAGAATDSHRLSNRQQEQRLREQLRQPAARARVARHPLAAAHRGGRARLAPQRHAGHLRADAPVDAGRAARQRRLQERRRRVVPRRARHQVLAPSGRAPEQEAGRAGSIAAELVETTRLYGRGLAAIEPQWIPAIAGHLLKKQLLEPHWEKKAAEVVALERATLYGIVVYSNRRVNFAQRRSGGGARDLHPRGAGRRRVGHASCRSWRTTAS